MQFYNVKYLYENTAMCIKSVYILHAPNIDAFSKIIVFLLENVETVFFFK